jgi:tetratricopeptide (TPR) repeat protein
MQYFLGRCAETMEPESFQPEIEKNLQELNTEFEIDIHKYLVDKDPGDMEAMAQLAELYTRSGRYEAGLKVDLMLAAIDPNNPVVHYNLACSYSLLNQVDSSLAELEIAINLGYSDAKHMSRDSDLENVKASPRFMSLLASIRN